MADTSHTRGWPKVGGLLLKAQLSEEGQRPAATILQNRLVLNDNFCFRIDFCLFLLRTRRLQQERVLHRISRPLNIFFDTILNIFENIFSILNIFSKNSFFNFDYFFENVIIEIWFG